MTNKPISIYFISQFVRQAVHIAVVNKGKLLKNNNLSGAIKDRWLIILVKSPILHSILVL